MLSPYLLLLFLGPQLGGYDVLHADFGSILCNIYLKMGVKSHFPIPKPLHSDSISNNQQVDQELAFQREQLQERLMGFRKRYPGRTQFVAGSQSLIESENVEGRSRSINNDQNWLGISTYDLNNQLMNQVKEDYLSLFQNLGVSLWQHDAHLLTQFRESVVNYTEGKFQRREYKLPSSNHMNILMTPIEL